LLSKRAITHDHEVHVWKAPREIEHSVGTFDRRESSKKPDNESVLRNSQVIPKPSPILGFDR
jgi:hypothetical protein